MPLDTGPAIGRNKLLMIFLTAGYTTTAHHSFCVFPLADRSSLRGLRTTGSFGMTMTTNSHQPRTGKTKE